MVKRLITALTTILVLSIIDMSCAPPAISPAEITEQEIPPHFSTYTSEGLFSISYPPEWEPATSFIEEVLESAKEWVESKDPEATFEGVQVLFLAGLAVATGWWPNVNIVVQPRSVGYWTLDEAVEADARWSKEHAQNYREFSRVKTVIDRNEAIIIDSQDYDPDYGTCRYLQSYIVKGKHVWTVTCTVDADSFKDYEDIFDSVVRSLRILR
jgi:hypothetical protein